MPELPEVERIRGTLEAHLLGRRIVGVTLRRRDVCTAHSGHRPTEHDLLMGATVDRLERRGKQLAIVATDARVVCVHLGMSGQLWRCPDDRPFDRHVHLRWRLDRGGELVFRDPRRFGGVWTFPSVESLMAVRWASLGPDALSITADDLLPALAGTERAIKAALLDQAVLAGVGNIYADEALFRAGIHPLRRSDRLRPPEIVLLAASIREILARAIDAGGSTIRDYRDGNGNSGGAQNLWSVYSRAGQGCARCGRVLKAIRVAQRATVFCGECQPRHGASGRSVPRRLSTV